MGKIREELELFFGNKRPEKFAQVSKDEYDQASSVGEEKKDKVIVSKDCLGCKIVGSSVCFCFAMYCTYQGYQNPTKAVGKKLWSYRVMTGSLASALLITGFSRMTDTGVFSKKAQDKGIWFLMKEEVAWLYKAVGKEPPKSLIPSDNKDKES